MEEEQKSDLETYLIDGDTGEMKPLGKTLATPILAYRGIVEEKYMGLGDLGKTATFEGTIVLRTIKKKRFIKLLMGMGYQINDAYIMHKEYMKKHKSRTKLGMIMFESNYKRELEIEFIFKIQGEQRK